MRVLASSLLLAATLSVFNPSTLIAQPPPELLLPAQAMGGPSRRDVPARRARKARVNLKALEATTLRLPLFDDMQLTITRKQLQRPGANKMVWIGADEYGTQAVLTVAGGVLTGTVFADHRSFEITIDADGQYTVAELDPTAFPTDDPEFDGAQFEVLGDPDSLIQDALSGAAASASDALTSDTPVEIDVMIVWTPNAEAAVGGRNAMDSLVLNSVANANLVYGNSGVNARLRLVHAAPVVYTETPSSISTDLSNLRGTTDGKLDTVHALRTQYGADIVSLFGDGYRSAGTCGIGGLMSTLSTSFASSAFNVVDRGCAVSNLSYAHEVGHNQGLHHDPSNASSTPSQTYAYGYQDPSGYFRTVMSYGSSTRIPYLSSPLVTYNTRVTGTSVQDNARALNASAGVVAAFRSVGGTTTPTTPACTYTVSTTSLSYAASGGSKTVTVTAPSGCTWSAAETSTWVTLSTVGGSGTGSVTVTAAANSAGSRSATITVAGRTVGVTQSGVKSGGKGGKATGDKLTR